MSKIENNTFTLALLNEDTNTHKTGSYERSGEAADKPENGEKIIARFYVA